MLNIIYKSSLAILGVSLSVHGADTPAPPFASGTPAVTRASETPAPALQTPPFAAAVTEAPASTPAPVATEVALPAPAPSITPAPTPATPIALPPAPSPAPAINPVMVMQTSAPAAVPLAKKTYQQLMETPSNPWLDEEVSLDAKSRIDRMRASAPISPADIKMKSLYPAWREAIDKYPAWVEAMASYPTWTPTAYSIGYKSWNMGTNDTKGLALALAESKYNIGNIDSFNQYISSLETSGLLPGAKFIKKEDRSADISPLNTVSGKTIEQYDAAKAEHESNPVVRAYTLLQNGVNFWEASDDPLGKLKGMCCIMAAKAQVSIAKADSMGYNMNLIASAINYATQAFNNAKEASNADDPRRLGALYEMIVGASMETVKIIGLTRYTPGRKNMPMDSRMAALIIDADAKISYFIDVISQSSQGMMKMNQAELMMDLRIVAQELSTMQSIIAQNAFSKKIPKK